ncbi:hypothetical protein AQUCO_00201426v1 [Aquilegia coerulea]|uniref:NB-ARC domain-containing protein n=1 Tax=Aquilegia coerulea TaxID=218851 RepID=A0A2G5F7Z9_AQUCA|nr:hypothetical protein AQUCO_00201426v1 [Aquilegia coerulea]
MVKEVGLLWNANDGFKKLERTLLRVQAMLEDVENKEISHRAWKAWVKDLKDAAYEADDLLDEIAITSTMSSSQEVNMSSFPSIKPHKIDTFQKKVDEIAREMEYLYMSKLVGSAQIKTKERLPTSSLLMEDEHCFFGREADKTKMIDVILSESLGGNDNVTVVSVVGMAGIGKTTFAQVVYNDERVCKHFESRMWVSVNNDFDVKKITKSIIVSASNKVIDLMDLDPLQVTLRHYLTNKRFFLVLDDVWSENYNDWDILQAPLRVGAPGSKILITSRSQTVSKIMMASHVLSLQRLSDDDCWLLFQKRALGNMNSRDVPLNLKTIGMEIVRKCEGLPLAAKTLGSLLHAVTNENEWNTILMSEIWNFEEDRSNILPALMLSFQYLPSHLRQCFAYCAIFPRGYEFKKENLVLLWIAQGFIQAKRGRRLEDLGSDYFDSLMCKSFFQEAPADSGNLSRYVMHDLIHDLAKFVSGDECLEMQGGGGLDKPYISGNVRHLSFLKGKVSTEMYEALYGSQSLRTVLLSSELTTYPIHDVHFNLFVNLNCLRVLDLSITRIHELPYSIGNLKHLRYFDLSMTRIQTLHKNICSLYSLQTLKLKSCTELIGLPKGLVRLANLRHLDLDLNPRLTSVPPGFGRLIDLQTLGTFIAGVDTRCQIGELMDMRSLHGTLCITQLENVDDRRKATQAALNDKQHLRKLKFLWGGDSQDNNGVLAGLRPHQNIEELHIEYYGGTRFPGWLADSSLSKLVTLSLFSCRRCKTLPSLGQLPSLKALVITNIPEVETIDVDFCGAGNVRGFPSLEILDFSNMASLQSWNGLAEGDLPCLRKLTFSSCLKLEALPKILCSPALEHIKISDCPEVEVLKQKDLPISVRSLIINSCSLLKRWHETEGKNDLSRIASDREVTIDGLRISSS